MSINSGSISNNSITNLNNEPKIISVKPINSLITNLRIIDDLVEKSSQKKISIVGGGVAAFELSFALYKRYNGNVSLNIISSPLLAEKNLNISTINRLIKIANNLGINLISNQVINVNNSEIALDNGDKIQSDCVLLSTGASLPDWLEKSDLEKTENFIAVNHQLQSLNNKNIFVTGDAATIKNYKRPKSGVMAVRQGEVLKENLFLFLLKKTIKKNLNLKIIGYI